MTLTVHPESEGREEEVRRRYRQAQRQQEKVRRAKAEEAMARQREKAAQQQTEEAEREQQQGRAGRGGKATTEAGAERQRLQAQQLESMDVGQLLQKAKELQDKINQVAPEVRTEVNRQVAAIPKPQKTRVVPKDELEKESMYQQHLSKARRADKERA